MPTQKRKKAPAARARRGSPRGAHQSDSIVPSIEVSALPGYRPVNAKLHDGDKWAGGFGATELLTADYWTLRARSAQLFRRNLYARGLISRLVTNEINTGLHLEADPEEGVLGLEEESLSDWSEGVENLFELWGKDPNLCDQYERMTFGAQQGTARLEALICGDVLVVLRQDQRTGLPRPQLIAGERVQSPMNPPKGARIKHGVELDAQGRHVAYWVVQETDANALGPREVKRLPAYGEKSGRRLAWLYYGEEKRLDDVRGEPILSIVLQSLREIDRYRDSTQRKATINSMLAMFVQKAADKPGSKAFSRGATRKGTQVAQAEDGSVRRFFVEEHIPGVVMQELQVGEEPKAFPSHGTDEKFGEFEEAIIQAIAWAREIPPEILRLAFSNNYSASQAAINEFKMYLNRARTTFGETFCAPIYVEWLLGMVRSQKVKAAGLLEAYRSIADWEIFAAWTASDWAGHIKPAVDLTKLVTGYADMVREGFITRDRASRELTGMKFSKIMKKAKRESELLAEVMAPLMKLEAMKKPAPEPAPKGKPDDIDHESTDEDDEPGKDSRANGVAAQGRNVSEDGAGARRRRGSDRRAAIAA
jgi:lambda family phage portal protein